MPENDAYVDQRSNPECSPNRCRACLGYGVVLTGRGPSYRRCEGEEREGWKLSEAMAELGASIDAMPRHRLRARRAAMRDWKRLVRRYREVVLHAR